MDNKKRKQADLERINPKQIKDKNAAYFKLVGGPWHGNKVRVYAPWDALDFNGVRYEIHPPLGDDDKWVYIHAE